MNNWKFETSKKYAKNGPCPQNRALATPLLSPGDLGMAAHRDGQIGGRAPPVEGVAGLDVAPAAVESPPQYRGNEKQGGLF